MFPFFLGELLEEKTSMNGASSITLARHITTAVAFKIESVWFLWIWISRMLRILGHQGMVLGLAETNPNLLQKKLEEEGLSIK
jgi:hypothetical protein